MKNYYVVFTNDACVEGFITNSVRDANWTATGRGMTNAVPALGESVREFLDDEYETLPLRHALVFDTPDLAAALIASEAKVARLREALQFGCAASINSLLASQGFAEWGRDSGIGTMLAALGCHSTRYDEAARAALLETGE
ncbi:MAG: hypothetical protein ACRCYS_13830 [Beijerinckiaceae bacterium]